MRSTHALLGSLVACYGASFIGTECALRGLGGWYLVIDRPKWALPSGAYIPIWTVVFGVLALAGWLALTAEKRSLAGLALFFSQLILAASWPWLFFTLHLLFVSTGVVLITWGLTLAVAMLFVRSRPISALLVMPYFLWLTYAAALDITVMRMNAAPPNVTHDGRT